MAHQRSCPDATCVRFGILRYVACRHFGSAPLCCRTAAFPVRRCPFRPPSAIQSGRFGWRAQAVEHVAQLLGHNLAHDLGHARAESDPAPLGVALDRIGGLVVRGHILGTVARQDSAEPVLTRKIVTAIMQVYAVAMPRQCDIAAVGIHTRRRQHMDAVDRHALRLVDRRGISMVDAVVILELEAHGSVIVGLHGHRLRIHLFDSPERAVLNAEATLVLQEHDAISNRECSLAALDRHTHLVA